jgi:prohibitin 2
MTEPVGSWWRSERTSVFLVGTVVVLGFLTLLFWWAVFVVILPGHAGVLYDLFLGTRPGVYLREGLKVKLPWNRMYIYDVRLQAGTYKVQALSREGMMVDVDMVVLFRPKPDELALLHKEIGPDYTASVVAPVATGVVREYFAQHDSHELYTVDAKALKAEIMSSMHVELGRHHIVVDDVLLQRLEIPKAILAAIEHKLTEEQHADAYAFRLEAEKAEAQRLEIRGTALNRYYTLVNGALTPSLLTWRGIEATVELAQSPNSKVIIVGSGKDQLPIILGSDISKLPDASKLPEARPDRPGPPAQRKLSEGPIVPDRAGPGETRPPLTPGAQRPPQIVPRP